MFFDGWYDLWVVLVSVIFIYTALVIILRITGNRTLSSLNAFDFIVTVTLGSTVASTILSENVSITEGITALATLAAIQYTVSKLSVFSKSFKKLITSEPILIVRKGQMLEDAMRQQRLTEQDLEQAAHLKGLKDWHEAEAVILETNGKLSVIAG